MFVKLKFPKEFMWGTATSSHQIEGGSNNNDWSHAAFRKYQNEIQKVRLKHCCLPFF